MVHEHDRFKSGKGLAAGQRGASPAPSVALHLQLQRTAGNRATTRVLSRTTAPESIVTLSQALSREDDAEELAELARALAALSDQKESFKDRLGGDSEAADGGYRRHAPT